MQQSLDEEIQQSPLIKLKKIQSETKKEIYVNKKQEMGLGI